MNELANQIGKNGKRQLSKPDITILEEEAFIK